MVLHIKDFPDDVHRALKVEAAEKGIAIYNLIIEILRRHVEAKGAEK